jgi:hypothetical protein
MRILTPEDSIIIEQELIMPKRPVRELLRGSPRRRLNHIHHEPLWINKKTTQFAWLPVKAEVLDQACSRWIWFEAYTNNKLYMVTRAGPPLKIINTRN